MKRAEQRGKAYSLTCLWLLLAPLLVCLPARAQEVPTETTTSETSGAQTTDTQVQEDALIETLMKRIEELETKSEALENKTKDYDDAISGLELRSDNLEDEIALDDMTELGDEDTVDSFTRILNIYGFFDLTLQKYFFKDTSMYNMFMNNALSFASSNANIFIDSRLSDSISVLMELRFSFLPLGRESNYEMAMRLSDDSEIPLPNQYEREDTKVIDPLTTEVYRLGGVAIERVQLTYAPRDWLKVVAGRYLTPYGIWNVDHGTTVVLPVRIPYMQSREAVPKAQTGLP